MKRRPVPLFCLVCGVDSGPTLTFFFWLVGGSLLAFACLGFWGYLTGKFRSQGATAEIPLKIEGGSDIHGNR